MCTTISNICHSQYTCLNVLGDTPKLWAASRPSHFIELVDGYALENHDFGHVWHSVMVFLAQDCEYRLDNASLSFFLKPDWIKLSTNSKLAVEVGGQLAACPALGAFASLTLHVKARISS